jgi:hypothetical protein
MHLAPEQLKKYRLLHERLFGVKISEEEALEQGENLVRFFEFLLKPPDFDDDD